MKYPITNISVKTWENKKTDNDYIKDNALSFNFQSEKEMQSLINTQFVDSNGNIYKLTSNSKIPIFKRILKFSIFSVKYDLVFENMNQKMTIEDYRNLMYDNIKNMPYQYDNLIGEDQKNFIEEKEHREYWLNLIKTSNSFEDIMNG